MSTDLAAIVPMKRHSERVPDKNFREFNGRPLFHWILHTLRAVPEPLELVVDTDSPEIAVQAREKFGATVIDRPNRLRGDSVSMNDILLHDVTEVGADLYLQTHCTNPLLRPETVMEAVEQYNQHDCDSLFSVTFLHVRLWDSDLQPINHIRGDLKPTQDLDPVYEENSNIYVFTRGSIERTGSRIGETPARFEMDAKEAVDIDYPSDFSYAEFLHRRAYGDEPEPTEVVDGE